MWLRISGRMTGVAEYNKEMLGAGLLSQPKFDLDLGGEQAQLDIW